MTKSVLLIIILLLTFSVTEAQTPSQTGQIQGTVANAATRSPLPGAAVSVMGTSLGAMTDIGGKYRIDQVPPGTYNIKFSMIGSKALVRTTVSVSPGRVTELSVSLEEEAVTLEGVTVTARESYFRKDPEAEVSGRTIDTEEILSAAGGVMDVQRVIQALPSVTTGSDQMNEIIVRGGNYGENLFIMDGIEIPNPNHFAFQGAGGGPISLLRSEFIHDVSFLAGAFPARFGDKASSVMDISLRTGNRDKHLSNLDMSMAGIGMMAEGPLGNRGSYLVSGRKSFLDLIISGYGLTAIPRYYNLQSKVTWSLNDRHTLLWNSVYGDDSIRIEPGEDLDEDDEENVDQTTNLMISGLTLKSMFASNLYAETVLSFVQNDWSTDVWENGANRSEAFYGNQSVESELTLKHDLNWLFGRHELSGGFSLKNSRFDHDIFSDADTVFTYDTAFDRPEQDTVTGIYLTYPEWRDRTNVSTMKAAGYAQLRLNPTKRLSLRLGGRYDYMDYTGHGYLAPRLGLRYRLSDALWLNGAYGVHYQSPSYIELTMHPANRSLKDYHTKQAVVGTEWLPRPDTRITLEAYSKQYRDVPVSKAWTTPDPWDYDEGQMMNAARGHAEGIEFYLQRKMSTSYMYILSYSFYRAWFEDPRTGEERPWDFDHRNLFTVSASKRWRPGGTSWYPAMKSKLWYKITAWLLPFGDEVMLSAKWRFAGGRPFTEPLYLRDRHVWIVPENTVYNAARFPDYHRLDIRLDRRFYFNNWSLVAYFDIMNAYGRDNIWDYSRDKYGRVEQVNQFSTMPVGGFNVEF